MIKISFELFGLTMLEPMALLLNWVLCGQALFYYSKCSDDITTPFLKYWRGFFLFFAISTFFGGLSHLFYDYLGMMGKIPGWLAACLAISSIEMAVFSESNPKIRARLIYLVQFKFLLTITLLITDLSFKWVMIHTAIGLVMILGISSVVEIAKGKAQHWFFVLAILSMVLTLPFRLLDINPHLWFNRDDVGHTLMMVTLYLFYRGIIKTFEESLVTKPLM